MARRNFFLKAAWRSALSGRGAKPLRPQLFTFLPQLSNIPRMSAEVRALIQSRHFVEPRFGESVAQKDCLLSRS